MTAVSEPMITVVLPSSSAAEAALKMQRPKSRTSLLADLIAVDEDSHRTTSSTSTADLTGLTNMSNDVSPKKMLQEILGDFFVDADALEKKELLGEGGFAVVHRCLYYDKSKGEKISVAMKELKPHLLANVDDLREFIMEASLQKKLHHSNIVRIIGVGATDYTSMQSMRRTMFILQEFVPGKSLKEMVIQQMCHRNVHVYSMKRAVGWLMDVAYALHYLHEVCRPMIVHRDLKLDNILLSQNGKSAKLCDFGLHKRIRTQGAAPGSVSGSMQVNLSGSKDESYYGGLLYQSLMDRLAEDDPSHDSGEHSLSNGASTLRDLTLSTQLSLASQVSSQSQKSQPIAHYISNDVCYSERPAREESKIGFTGKVGSIVYMAPEVFLNKPYNEKVDVFSFAVIMFELLAQTNISVKYGMMEERGALNGYAEKVAKGFREKIPDHWPDYVKMLVTECWDENPINRPSFKDIIHRLTFIHDSEIVEKISRPLINTNALPISCCCMQ